MTYKVQKYRVQLIKDGVERVVPRDIVHNDWCAAEVFATVLRNLPHEEVWMILCGARNDVRGLVKVSQGGAHGAALKASDVLRVVLTAGVDSFILGHNHPSGDPAPSQADVEMTRHLVKASELVGLTLLDHIVWTDAGGWRSLRDSLPM